MAFKDERSIKGNKSKNINNMDTTRISREKLNTLGHAS